MRRNLAKLGLAVVILLALGIGIGAITWSRSSSADQRVQKLSRIVGSPSGMQNFLGITADQIQAASSELRALGPKAEESLARQLRSQDTFLGLKYQSLYPRFPRFLRRILPPYESTLNRRQNAIITIGKLRIMSPQMESVLVQATQDTNLMVSVPAALILDYRGSQSPQVLQAVNNVRTNRLSRPFFTSGPAVLQMELAPTTFDEMIADLKRPSAEVRYIAIGALRELGLKAQPAIPNLITACANPEIKVRVRSARTLGDLGGLASNAIPILQRMTNDEIWIARKVATESLQQIQNLTVPTNAP